MKIRGLFFLLAVFFIAPQFAEAQLIEGVINRAQRKVERIGERKIEEKLDKVIEDKFFKVDEETGEVRTAFDATVDKDYSFKMRINYEMKGSSSRDNNEMELWIGNGPYMGMTTDAQQDAFIVIDDDKMVTFREQEKTYMAFNFNTFAGKVVDAAVENQEDGEVSIKKIGKEKIVGYNCDIYEVTGDDGVSKMWITEEITAGNFTGSFANLTKNNKIPEITPGSGLMLKLESKGKKKSDDFSMAATSADKTNKEFKTSEYRNALRSE